MASYHDTALPLRTRISRMLDACVLGFLEGSVTGMQETVAYKLKYNFNIVIPRENITVIFETLNSIADVDGNDHKRRCLSVHVKHDDQHYESIIRNISYDDGREEL